MINLELVFSEIFLSLSIMALLLIGVYKKNSTNMIYNYLKCCQIDIVGMYNIVIVNRSLKISYIYFEI